jgi:glycine hydroxymethyltransferase
MNKTTPQSYFLSNKTPSIAKADPELNSAINQEVAGQEERICLIASENYTHRAVMEAQGSVLTNKYAEGYSGKRYYAGCNIVDMVEDLASERLKRLFKCEYVNTQPLSGTTANLAAFMAFLKPGDKILGMSLSSGGHLTHGSKASLSGKWFVPTYYNVNKDTMLMDYDEIEAIAIAEKPKLIIAGYSSHSRIPNWQKFRSIADRVGAYFMCDIAHIAGLIASGEVESPIEYADVVTSTTHKTLRGPRGGIIMSKDKTHEKVLQSAVFPATQGGPLMHVIAGKAACFHIALQPEFKEYAKQVISNAKTLAKTLMDNNMYILTHGTDNHMMVVDLTKNGIDGITARNILESANIICSQSTIPFDTKSAIQTSGIRLGTPAATARGMKEKEFERMGILIAELLKTKSENDEAGLEKKIKATQEEVSKMCKDFPIYSENSL